MLRLVWVEFRPRESCQRLVQTSTHNQPNPLDKMAKSKSSAKQTRDFLKKVSTAIHLRLAPPCPVSEHEHDPIPHPPRTSQLTPLPFHPSQGLLSGQIEQRHKARAFKQKVKGRQVRRGKPIEQVKADNSDDEEVIVNGKVVNKDESDSEEEEEEMDVDALLEGEGLEVSCSLAWARGTRRCRKVLTWLALTGRR